MQTGMGAVTGMGVPTLWLILYNTSRNAHISRDNFESSITSRSYPACEYPPKSIGNICNFNQHYQVSRKMGFLFMMIFSMLYL